MNTPPIKSLMLPVVQEQDLDAASAPSADEVTSIGPVAERLTRRRWFW